MDAASPTGGPTSLVVIGADDPIQPAIAGVVVRDLVRHGDARGGFTETYRQEWHGGPPMVQGNRSDSAANVVRGLHFHRRQADYWLCLRGRIIAVMHDLRPESPTRGTTMAVELDGNSSRALYIPPRVAHGFGTLSETTLTYLVDRYYDASDEFGIRYDDPAVGFDWSAWGLSNPTVSGRDAEAGTVADLDPALLEPATP